MTSATDVRTSFSPYNLYLLRRCSGGGASWSCIFDARHCDLGFDSHAEFTSVDRRFFDRRRTRGSVARRSIVYGRWNFSAGGTASRLYGRREDRGVAQRRASIRQPADQRNHRYCSVARDESTLLIALGTVLVVGGIILISWKRSGNFRDFVGGICCCRWARRFSDGNQSSDSALCLGLAMNHCSSQRLWEWSP